MSGNEVVTDTEVLIVIVACIRYGQRAQARAFLLEYTQFESAVRTEICDRTVAK